MANSNFENPDSEEPPEAQNSKLGFKGFQWIIIIGFFLFFLYLIFKNPKEFFGKYIWKRELTTLYSVDKKTINKWVKYFGENTFPIYNEYLKRRKISYMEYFSFIQNFGSISDFPVLSKKEIVEKCEGTYRSLRNSIEQYPDKFGISPEAFSDLRKFPPKVGRQIVEQYG